MGVSSFCSGRGPKKSVPSRLQRVWSLASDDLKAAPLAAKLMKSYALLAEPWHFFYQKMGKFLVSIDGNLRAYGLKHHTGKEVSQDFPLDFLLASPVLQTKFF